MCESCSNIVEIDNTYHQTLHIYNKCPCVDYIENFYSQDIPYEMAQYWGIFAAITDLVSGNEKIKFQRMDFLEFMAIECGMNDPFDFVVSKELSYFDESIDRYRQFISKKNEMRKEKSYSSLDDILSITKTNLSSKNLLDESDDRDFENEITTTMTKFIEKKKIREKIDRYEKMFHDGIISETSFRILSATKYEILMNSKKFFII